jgi:hypothetical protein
LATLLDQEDPVGGLRAIDTEAAVNRFGTNGLRVARSSYEGRVLSVVLEDLPFHRINPCFQAIIEAARFLPQAEHFEVRLRDRDLLAVNLPRSAVDAADEVWLVASARFHEMPLSTFLPANVVARLQVETHEQAAIAVAWLGLNDAAHAFNDAHAARALRVPWAGTLAARLDLVGRALATSAGQIAPSAASALRRAYGLVSEGRKSADFASKGGGATDLALIEDEIQALLEISSVPSVLPTVDPRDMNQVLADLPVTS